MNQPEENLNRSGESETSAGSAQHSTPRARPIGQARPIGTSDRSSSALRLENISVGTAWLDLLVIVLALVAFEFSTSVFIRAKWGSFDQMSDELFAQMQQAILPYVIGGRGLLVVIVIFLVSRLRRLSSGSVGITANSFGKNCFVGVAALGAAWSLIAVCQLLLVMIVPGFLENATENVKRIKELLPDLPVFGYLMLSLFVGVYEELLFRGFLLPRLRRATGSWALAVFLTTAVFVVMHLGTQTVAIIAPLSILSITFCLTTIWRQSLVPAIVAHALFDLVNFLIINRAM